MLIRIYSVGVWNPRQRKKQLHKTKLEFTPLEFETQRKRSTLVLWAIRIYSVGVWNVSENKSINQKKSKLEFTPLEFETLRFVFDLK